MLWLSICSDYRGNCITRLCKIWFFFRIYTEVYHAKTSFSPTSEPIIPIREAKELQNFFEEFYSEIDVTPEEVEYIEAHGAGK